MAGVVSNNILRFCQSANWSLKSVVGCYEGNISRNFRRTPIFHKNIFLLSWIASTYVLPARPRHIACDSTLWKLKAYIIGYNWIHKVYNKRPTKENNKICINT